MLQGRTRLTDRDVQVLGDCYRSTVLSFSQIQRRYFAGLSTVTVSNRLGQLVRAGFLTKTRAGVSLPVPEGCSVGAVFQPTRQGLKMVAQLFPNEHIRGEPSPLNLNSLAHDLVLNDVSLALRKRFHGLAVVNGRLIQNGQSLSGKRSADAVILNVSGKPLAAIELELTAKSKKRYREIILQYQLSIDTPNVIYIVAGSSIREKISYQITNQRVIPGLPPPSTGKFYFVTLSDLLRDPIQSRMTNGPQDFSVTNLTGSNARLE